MATPTVPPGVTFITYRDLEEMLELNPNALVYVIDPATEKPYVLRLSTLVANIAVTDFDVDGGTFI